VINFTPRPLYLLERAGTHWIEGWMGPIIALDNEERRKISPLAGLEF
jgi:hypothetical protein